MSFYNKNACPVCEKTFEPSDEIVVCPECGTRYHKACYQQAGACLFQNRHGEEIPPDEDTAQDTNPNGENTQEGDTLVCPRCQTPNPSENIFCNRCGTALRAPFNQGFGANPNMGQNPNVPPFNPFVYAPSEQELKEEIDGVTVKELITNVGPNAQYYVPRFQLFSRQKGPGISPNWSAFFFNFFFFFYRKMYAIGAVLLVVFLASLVPTVFVALDMIQQMFPQFAQSFPFLTEDFLRNVYVWENIITILRLTLMLFFGLFANRMYMASVIKRIKKLKAQNLPQSEYQAALIKRGGINRKIIGVAVFGFLLVYVGLMVILSFSMMYV